MAPEEGDTADAAVASPRLQKNGKRMNECDLGEMSSPASASSAVPLRLEAGGERGELGDEMGTWKAGCPPPRLSSRFLTGHHARCCDSPAGSGQLSWALPGAFPEFLLPHRYYPAPLIPGLNSATARWQLVGEGSEGPDDRTRRCSCLPPAGGPRDAVDSVETAETRVGWTRQGGQGS